MGIQRVQLCIHGFFIDDGILTHKSLERTNERLITKVRRTLCRCWEGSSGRVDYINYII